MKTKEPIWWVIEIALVVAALASQTWPFIGAAILGGWVLISRYPST